MPIATEQADIQSETPRDALLIPPAGVVIEDYTVGNSGGGAGGDTEYTYGSA